LLTSKEVDGLRRSTENALRLPEAGLLKGRPVAHRLRGAALLGAPYGQERSSVPAPSGGFSSGWAIIGYSLGSMRQEQPERRR
jgi:hypothetical protein